MSDLEDFKLGGQHNAGDPEGRRVMTDKSAVQATPRTDAALVATLESCGYLDEKTHAILVDLARTLERELSMCQPQS